MTLEWKNEVKNAVRTVEELEHYIELTQNEKTQLKCVLERYPMAITEYALSLIKGFDRKDDPIRKMLVPCHSEVDETGTLDTSGEASYTIMEGLQHKYDETVLILTTHLCAAYCRHCFRRRMVGLTRSESIQNLDAMREYILSHNEISNALLSGGDALMNSNERLDEILSMLDDIGHLDFIRIGSRVPVVLPSRVSGDEGLISMLGQHNKKKQIILMTQYNHPRELTEQSLSAVRRVQKGGITVKNQTVLLRGVNDNPEILGELMRGLTKAGIVPYYVFQCRPVKGVKNQFQVPLLRAVQVVKQARAMQNGLGKAFRYCMAHVTGKIEILGVTEGNRVAFKYHEAADRQNLGKFFFSDLEEQQAWLDQV